MILLVHLLFGAAIGSAVKNIPLAIILAFLSHYFLDLLPHIEYPIENITNKQWQKAAPDILKVILDFSLGILLIIIFSKNYPIIYVCAFFAILPDGLSFLESASKNKILREHNVFHHEKIHFLKYKKISNFWRISTQVATVLICIYFLRF